MFTEKNLMLSIKDIIAIAGFTVVIVSSWIAFEKRIYRVETEVEANKRQKEENARQVQRIEQKIDLLRDDVTTIKIDVGRKADKQ